ncbi:hypothetical protein ACNO7L_10840 [Bisgaard Taxon 45]|uniref:Uncharacterized protein n=1 Tax=Bisgaard Taxon 45 TaxID=304289 RepID=A0ABT9KDK6_9PAST|nr:hypothetical protein [Bisgaard Taxon 45]
MTKEQKDFEFLRSIFEKFFNQKSTQKKLNLFDELDVSDWEKWLQIELMFFLNELDEVAEVKREERCFLDKRKEKDRDNCVIDFLVRQKKAHSAIPIEVKRDKVAKTCISKMINDIKKYEKIKPSNLPTNRLLWCIGVHNQVTEEYINDLVSEFNTGLVFSMSIKNTQYMITLF